MRKRDLPAPDWQPSALKFLKKTGPQASKEEEAETAKLIQTNTEYLGKAVDPQASKEEEEAETAKLIQTDTERL